MEPLTETAGGHHTPERQCIVCRRRAARDALVRLVRAPSGEIVADLGWRLPGRGAHCCPTRRCLEAAMRPAVLSRAFRTQVMPPDRAAWLGALAGQAERAVHELLGLYAKGGVAIAGAERLKARLAHHPSPSGMLCLADDAGQNTASRWRAWAEEHKVDICQGLDKDRLGKALGMAECSVVWLTNPKAAQRVEWLLGLLAEAAACQSHG
jgi:predicted RNA-binding protein YlxR (DUF448 family)/ribosomal protein L7Ae-like RNA K-turn-binding protein